MTRLDALAGLVVLEVSTGQNFAVPYATKLLADLGADVTVAEPPGGHPLRRGHPGQPENPAIDAAVYGFLSQRKRCTSVAGSADHGAGQLAELIDAADIVVVTAGTGGELPSAVSRLLAAPAPGAARAVVTVSPWGSGGGPYAGLPATPITLQAAAGWVTSRKEVDMWPVQVGGQLEEWASGSFVATAALTAFRQAQWTGARVSVDLSLLECAHSFLCYDNLRYDARGELGVGRDRILVAPFGIRRCKDGWVGINTLTQQQWKDACELTGLTEYTGDQQSLNRGEGDLDAFAARLTEFLAEMTVDEVVELAQARRIPAAPVAAGTQMCGLRQWTARPFFVEFDLGGRRLRAPGAPFRLHSAPAARTLASAAPVIPVTGPNTQTVPIAAENANGPATPDGAPAGLPFSGLRVVDLSHFWSGPYLTMFLGAYGADVIKIESVQRPDLWRANHTGLVLGDRWHDRGVMWQATNLNKRDVTLDLGSEAGRELLLRLCATADVFVENFAVRVLDRLGLTYDVIREINPRMIMLRLPGFGLDGPWRDYVGFGDSFEQIGGLATVTGYPDGRPQTPGGYLDPMVGMHAGAALLAALRQRDLTGVGQLIEVPQIEVAASMSAPQLIGDELGVPPAGSGTARRATPRRASTAAGTTRLSTSRCRSATTVTGPGWSGSSAARNRSPIPRSPRWPGGRPPTS